MISSLLFSDVNKIIKTFRLVKTEKKNGKQFIKTMWVSTVKRIRIFYQLCHTTMEISQHQCTERCYSENRSVYFIG